MRVLQVSPMDAYPPTTGGERRIHGLVSTFPSEGTDVVRLAQGGLLANHDSLASASASVRRIEEGYTERRPRNPLYDLVRLPRVVGVPGLPFLSADRLFWARDAVESRLEWADLVLCEGPWQVPAVRRAAPQAPLVYSSHNVEADRDLTSPSHPLADRVRARVRRLEAAAVAESRAVVCVSERDATRFEAVYGTGTPTLIAPNATRAERLAGPTVASTPGPVGTADGPLGVFVGSAYGPNEAAAERLASLTPRIRDRVPGFELLVLGECGAAVRDPPPGVTTPGFVDDLDPPLAAADVAFNAVTRGGGTNVKLFDYFAHELPVITTPTGARGVDVERHGAGVVADLEEFPAWVERLVADQELARRLGRAGRRLVEERHTWERVSRTLHRDLRRLLGADPSVEADTA